MSKWDKLIEKILALSADLRFDELKKVLENLGYVEERSGKGGSHHSFRKADRELITIPKSNRVKKIYVKKVKEILEKEMFDEKQENA